jgi:hypothetical protein
MYHLRDTIFNSSDVLTVLKHDLQLSALASPSAFNQDRGSSIMSETGTHELVLREASLPGARLMAPEQYMGNLQSDISVYSFDSETYLRHPDTPLQEMYTHRNAVKESSIKCARLEKTC